MLIQSFSWVVIVFLYKCYWQLFINEPNAFLCTYYCSSHFYTISSAISCMTCTDVFHVCFHSAESAEVHSAVTTDKVTYRQIIINKKQENSNMIGKADFLHLHHGLFLQPDTLVYVWVSRSIHYDYFVGSMLTFPSKHEADENIIIFIGS